MAVPGRDIRDVNHKARIAVTAVIVTAVIVISIRETNERNEHGERRVTGRVEGSLMEKEMTETFCSFRGLQESASNDPLAAEA